MKFIAVRNTISNGWNCSVSKMKDINLIVGLSGSGKSMFMNTLFNLARVAVTGDTRTGNSEIVFTIDNTIYKWHYNSEDSNGISEIKEETLIKIDRQNNTEKVILTRSKNEIHFNNEIINISRFSDAFKQKSGIYILNNEPIISDVSKAFGNIWRNWGVKDEFSLEFSLDTARNFENSPENLKTLFYASDCINHKLLLLNRYRKDVYDRIIDTFKSVYSFVDNFEFIESQNHPNKQLHMIEKNLGNRIHINLLASGMKKVLSTITNIAICPQESVFLIDEYENSLCVNSIDFLIRIYENIDKKIQFLLTSHHPYIINNISIENWIVFNRKGNTVEAILGEDLKKKYGKSRQSHFLQLMNDVYYNKGIK